MNASPFQRVRSFTVLSLVFILHGRSVSASFNFEAYVKASVAGVSENFGYSVALSGDTLAVGAHLEDSCQTTISTTAATDNGCTDAGAVYVFTRSSTTWTLEAYVKAPNAGAEDYFGLSISLSGDTLAVGAQQEDSCETTISTTATDDNNCTNAGAVYVFTRSGTTWALEAYVKAPNAGAEDLFGEFMALSGETLAVSAVSEDSCANGVYTTAATDDTCTDAGAVYVFTRSGTTWTFEAYVKASGAEVIDNFGLSVALSSDTLAVGSHLDDSCETTISTAAATDNGCTDAGAVYVFTRSGTTWTLEAYVKAPNAEAEDFFGEFVALSGDTLAIAAVAEDSCATGISTIAATDNNCTNDAGAVYTFTRSGTTWAFESYIKAPNTGAFDHFGYSISLSQGTMAIGAFQEDSCATGVYTTGTIIGNRCPDAGAAYVYAPPQPPSPPASPSPPAASISGDPHVRGGHGDSFDFKGEHNGIYVLLSTPDLSISARFVHSSFFTPYSKLRVHGSWIKQVFWKVRTRHGQVLHTDLLASSPRFNGSTARITKTVDDVTFHFDERALAVTSPLWFTRATVQKGNPHPGHERISVTVRPLYNLKHSKVAPHGLLGQTYDDDNAPLHGKRDSYAVLDDGTRTNSRRWPGGVVTKRARGEGAIEGHAEMYRVRRPYDTEFAFTRFGRTAHLPARNVSLLRSQFLKQS